MKKLFFNAKFYSMCDEQSVYNAMLCEDGIIKELFKNCPSIGDCEKIDLHDLHVFPGFIDSHTHSFEGGLYQQGVDLSQCSSVSDVLDLLRDATIVGGMVFAWKFDENSLKEKRFPHREELNKLFKDIPILLRRVDGHSCVVNDSAIKMIKEKNLLNHLDFPEDGIFRSYFNDIAAHTFHKNLNANAIIDCYQTAQKIALENGHTTIHTMIGDAKDDYLHFPLMLKHLNDFTIDYIVYPQCFNLQKVIDLYNEFGIEKRRIGGCILADGSFGSFTAGLSEAYLDKPDCFGNLYQSQKFWDDFIDSAHQNNIQTGVHCIGDEAIMQIIKAVDFAQKKSRKDLRHQIIHCELVRDDMIDKMKDNGIYAVMQPTFDALWGGESGFYNEVLGKDRLKNLNRFKSLTENKVVVTGGSDWYITDLSALKGIDAAINHHNKSERLSNFEAIKLYTINPAKLNFEENKKGLLKYDFVADFVCLDKNILKESVVSKVNVIKTVKKAEFVYHA